MVIVKFTGKIHIYRNTAVIKIRIKTNTDTKCELILVEGKR